MHCYFHFHLTKRFTSREQKEDTAINLEIDTYLTMQKLDFFRKINGKREFLDPLKWWRDHVEALPLLAQLAGDFLSVQATSAPVERMFSTGGLTITKKRNRLESSISSDLIFLHDSWETLEGLAPDFMGHINGSTNKNGKRQHAAIEFL